jgi:hypothetical protein
MIIMHYALCIMNYLMSCNSLQLLELLVLWSVSALAVALWLRQRC